MPPRKRPPGRLVQGSSKSQEVSVAAVTVTIVAALSPGLAVVLCRPM